MANEKILVVDDDKNICELLRLYLVKEGYNVTMVHDGGAALAEFDKLHPDLVLLDVMMPVMDGWEVCRKLRAKDNTPIIMLTAKGETYDKVLGLELGADDYIVKPFDAKEVTARIKAVLRRQAPLVPGAPAGADEVVTFGDYQLFLATRELKKGDEVHMLTTGEFAVLKALVQHAREPLTRDKLMNLARGREWDALERSIDVQISRLRRLIEPDPSKPRYIQTVWGVGYVFVPDGNARKA